MRKMERWTSKELAPVYWLVLWGMTNNEVVDLTKDIIKDRSLVAIEQMAREVRKHLQKLKGLPTDFRAPKLPYATFKGASKVEPVKEIADLRPADLSTVKFITMGTKASTTHKSVSPKFEQRPDEYQQAEQGIVKAIMNQTQNPIKPQKQLTMAEVLQTAKEAGAKKVVWGDYVIKFR